MRYADLEAHHDLGLGAEEPDTRRFTRPSDRMAPKPVDSHVTEGDPSGMDLDSMFGAIEDGRRNASGADTIRIEALARLEDQIEHQWRVWEGLQEGTSRTTLASFIHDLEDRADQLAEDIRANRPGEESGPGRCANTAEAITPATASKEVEHDHVNP